MNWTSIKLGDVCFPKQHPTISMVELTDTGYPVYGANGQVGYYSKYTHEKETVAITCRGATCGTINIVPPYSYITGNAMALDQLDTKRVDIHFLSYALRQRGFHDVISGSAQPQITRAPLLNIQLSLPPLEEQKRIAAILDQADALRRLRQQSIDRLNDLGQAIFYEIFGDANAKLNKWPLGILGDVVRKDDGINYGVVQPGDDVKDGIPLIRAGDIAKPIFDINSVKKISANIESSYVRSRLRGDEILVGCVGSIGAIYAATDEMKGANIARAVGRVPIDPGKCNRLFIAEQLRTNEIQNYFKSETRTVAQPTLNIKQLVQTPIIIPPLSDQINFAERIEKILFMKKNYAKSATQFDKSFSSLQYRAFRDELTSKHVERELARAS